MKGHLSRCIVTLMAIVILAGAYNPEPQSKSSSKKSDSLQKYRRLPTYFGQLDLKDDQKEEIYSIREAYGPRIDELKQELAELREEEQDEIKDVLTRTQVTALNKLKAGAKSSISPASSSKSSSRRKSSRSSSSKKKDE